jgi:hypothetical protein
MTSPNAAVRFVNALALCPLLAASVACIDTRSDGSSGTGGRGGAGGDGGLLFEVDASRDRRAISPLIYGANANGVTCQPQGDVIATACRLGGNRWTAYNWETNASNAGADYCYQNDNFLGQFVDADADTPGAAATRAVAEGGPNGVFTLLTVPIVDYLAGDKDGGFREQETGACTNDVRDTENHLEVRMKRNQAVKPDPLEYPPNPDDDVVYQDEFVAHVRAFVEAEAGGATVAFSLDNEPGLWSNTHPEVHPEPVGYEELVARNIEYAAAIKQAWPEAPVVGFAGAGFPDVKNLWGGAKDATGKGDFLDYYLERMREAEVETGQRLIDYVDVHFYPEHSLDNEVKSNTDRDDSAAMVALRLESTRSLWDPDYVDPTWLSQAYGPAPVRFLPRLREAVEAHYPGTAVAVTEWAFGGGRHISGALVTADVLGLFGREGVTLANSWSGGTFTSTAFRAFRDYDGQGSGFGDTSIHAASSLPAEAAVYASIDEARPERMVIVAINKVPEPRVVKLTIAHTEAYEALDVFTVTEGGGAVIEPAEALDTSEPNVFRYEMPAHSLSILVPRQ